MDVILDVDPGVDDALAILLALSSPELSVLGLTVVSGNVPLDSGAENALRILVFAGREDIPVYKGADHPLRRPPVYAKQVHGESGLGEAVLKEATHSAREGAVGFLIKSLDEHAGQVTLLAVGPLTNLALAERRAPGTLDKAREVIVMGGAAAVPGNASPVAEFNFYVDPDAAREVIAACQRLVVVPLDVTRQIGIGSGEIERRIRPLKTARSSFFCRATEVVVRHGRDTGGYEGVILHDPAVVAYAIRPDLFGVESVWADVEAEGTLTAGQLVVDRRVGVTDEKRMGRPVRMAVETDAESVLNLFRQRVLDLDL